MAKRKVATFLVLLTFLFPFVSSAVFAAESEVKWARVNIPTEGSGGNWVLAIGSDVELLTSAVDGTLYAYANPTGTSYRLFKSKDGGFTWSSVGDVTSTIVDIAVAPDNASVIYYATPSNVYRSTDGGNNFVALAPNPGGAGGNNIEITSIDFTRQDGGYGVAVATRDRDIGQFGGIYTLKDNDPFRWVNTSLGNYDAYAVRFSPSFPADRQIVGVVTDETDTFVTMKSGDGGWGGTIGSARLSRGNASPPLPVAVANTATIAFPEDYEGYTAGGHCVLFIAIDAGDNNGDVYRINGSATPAFSVATDLNTGSGYGASNTDITGLAVSGSLTDINIAAGAARSGEVYFSRDGGRNWGKSLKPPTGDAKTNVVMASNFKSTGHLYAATSGNESGFSFSTDFGVIWNQRGLIDSALYPNGILDLAPSPNYPKDKTLFLITFGGKHSFWRSTNGGPNKTFAKPIETFFELSIASASSLQRGQAYDHS